MTSAYDFTFKTLQGEAFPLSALRGHPLLIVNTASKCGFTQQYAGLQNLWASYGSQGLKIIAVPCNDFGGQEPASAPEIGQFCELNYGVSFPVTSKEHAIGAQAHPFFSWVVEQKGFLARPRWNFYKYLISKDGELVNFFISSTKPESVRVKKAIERAL